MTEKQKNGKTEEQPTKRVILRLYGEVLEYLEQETGRCYKEITKKPPH